MPSRPTPTPVPALPQPSRPSLRRRVAVLLATALTLATVLAAAPAPAAADTASDMATTILGWMNPDRTGQGLAGYRTWDRLTALATERARRMAATHTLSHTVAGDIGNALDAAGIQWMGYGEIIGNSSYPWGVEAAGNIYSGWKGSPGHRSIMFSGGYNYIGIGVAQADDGTTWIAAVMTESPDHTAPVARNGTLRRRGTDVLFTWGGTDPRLQTRTAGIVSYDVRMRRDNGSWRLLRHDTTARRLVLPRRAHGHRFSFRVQAKDARGNLSPWTSEIRIWVP